MAGYDDYKTAAPDHGTVTDSCHDCGCDLFPEERERGQCRRCYGDYLANAGDDEAYEKEIA